MPFDIYAAIDIMPNQQLTSVMGRSYEIFTTSWSDASTGNLAVLNFPGDLFDVAQIRNHLQFYKYFYCKAIKIGIRINSTVFHFGRLNINHVTGASTTNLGFGSTPDYHADNIFQRRNNRSHLVSAMTAGTTEIEIPWEIPYLILKNREVVNGGGWESILARVFVDIMVPLGMAALSVQPVEVSIFASFVEPVLTGFLPKTGVQPLILAQGKKEKNPPTTEAISKSMSGVTSVIGDGVSMITSLMESVMSLGSAVLPMAAMVLDKPSTTETVKKVSVGYGHDMMCGDGLDSGTKFSLKQGAALTSESMFPHGGNPSLLWLMQRPGFLDEFNFQHDTASGAKVWSANVFPGAVYQDGINFIPSYLKWFSSQFHYWRGSIRYGIYFTCSKFTSCRLRISYNPDVNGDAPGTASGGDVISKIVDVTGDTFVAFTIPYLYETLWAENTSISDSASGIINIELINKVVSQTPTIVYATVFVSAGSDFQVSLLTGNQDLIDVQLPHILQPMIKAQCSINNDFDTDFESLVEAKGFKLSGYAQPETYDDLMTCMKRYQPNNGTASVSTTSIQGFPGKVQDGALELLYGSSDPIVNLCLPFKYYRGAYRLKNFYQSLPKFRKIAFNGDFLSGSGGAGIMVNVGNSQNGFEVEVPYFGRKPFRWLDGTDKRPDKSLVYIDEFTQCNCYYSVGDDFAVGGLFAPPAYHTHVPLLEKTVTPQPDIRKYLHK
jgi:hypothetical protein